MLALGLARSARPEGEQDHGRRQPIHPPLDGESDHDTGTAYPAAKPVRPPVAAVEAFAKEMAPID